MARRAKKISYNEARAIAIAEIERRGWKEYFCRLVEVDDSGKHDPDKPARKRYRRDDSYDGLLNYGWWHYRFTTSIRDMRAPEIVIHRRTGKILRTIEPRDYFIRR